ncbi:helix-turn-helix domain-containing protein [Candidatus Micrarchaeota archaeon]|nr:helix-turn-helix domain-containing protein [Candidatus Micrarchaeota archaeon]
MTGLVKKTILSALDNEEKLSVLRAVAEKPGQSITELRKNTGMSYSTLHKYLNQLDRAGFLASRPVSDVRLKKVYSPTDLCVTVSAQELVTKKPVQNAKLREALLDAGVSTAFADELSMSGTTNEAAQASLSSKIAEIQKASQVLRSLYSTSVSRVLSDNAWVREKTALGELEVMNYTNNFMSLFHDLKPVFERGLVLNGKQLTRKPKRLLSALSIAAQLIQRTQNFTDEHVLREFNFMIAEFSGKVLENELKEALQFFIYQCDATQHTTIELCDSAPPYRRYEKVTETSFKKLEREAARVNDTLISLLRDEKRRGKKFSELSIAWKSFKGKPAPTDLACAVINSPASGVQTSKSVIVPYNFSGLAQVFRLNVPSPADNRKALSVLDGYRREFEKQSRLAALGNVKAYCTLLR